MKFVYGHLCDYATTGPANKPILVGVFSHFLMPAAIPAPVPVQLGFFVLQLECGVAEGSAHDITIQLRDEDHRAIGNSIIIQHLAFTHVALGLPLEARVIGPLKLVELPGVGLYRYVVTAGGVELGAIPLLVQQTGPEV